MSAHNILGKAGEDAAAKYLEQNGYTIRDRNWRKNHLELDIVADKDKELIIVEVKTRSNTDYIEPQDAVNWQKTTTYCRSGRCLYQALLLGCTRPLRHHNGCRRTGCIQDRASQRSLLSADVLRVEN